MRLASVPAAPASIAACPSTKRRAALGGWIDAALVAIVVGFWFRYRPHGAIRDAFDVCVAVSLGGVYVAARRLLLDESRLPLGIALWGVHGVVSTLAIAAFMSSGATSNGVVTAPASGRALLYCLAALIVQLLIGLVTLYRLIHRRTCGGGDVTGSAFCVSYSVVVSAWVASILP
jgi:hypothetical protein